MIQGTVTEGAGSTAENASALERSESSVRSGEGGSSKLSNSSDLSGTAESVGALPEELIPATHVALSGDAMPSGAQRGLLDPQLMAALIESANDAIITKNLDGTITSWNKGAERVFGYTADEIIGRSVLLLIPSDRSSEEKEIIGRIKAGERIEHYETVRQRKDGTPIDISLTVSPIKAADGTITGASKIAREITDLKRTVQQLRESESRYRTLFDSVDEGFCVIEVLFDAEQKDKAVDYVFLEINASFERQTGIINGLGRRMREIAPEHEESWFEIYGKVALTGEPVRFTEGSSVLGRWFDLYAFRLGGPESHKVAVIFSDITAQKKSELERERLLAQIEGERAKLVVERAKLELERAKFAYMFEQAPAFVAMLKGPQHKIELANPSYIQLIGHRDVVGKTVQEALPEVKAQGFIALLDRVFQTGEAFTGRESAFHVHRAGQEGLEERFVDFVYQPIFEANNVVTGILVHGVDITDQVRARKEAENANRTKDEFLAVLSHELRTPLNAILGWSRMLGDKRLDDEDRMQGLEAIQRNAELQAQLVEDILDVSRIVTGKLRLEVRPTELSTVIEAAVESVLPAAEAKDIRLQRVLDSGTSLVSGDPHRLQQILWNLLTNSIKFTPKGGRVQVRLERVNSHIEIIVSDNGIGIPADVLPFIFDRFHQADSTSTRRYGGLGLGLSLVRHLTEMHGGTVEAESGGAGQGTTLTVRLPLIAVRSVDVIPERRKNREHPTARGKVPFEGAPELVGLRVLVVDDEDDARMLVKTVLERCGTQVTAVNSAEAALATLQEILPDVLVSDIGMPNEDGYSLIQKVRTLPATQGGHTPAAALTAYARVEDRLKALRSGFQMHIPKPVEPAELVAVVANLAGRHRNEFHAATRPDAVTKPDSVAEPSGGSETA